MTDNFIVPALPPLLTGLPGMVSPKVPAPPKPSPYGVNMNTMVNQQFGNYDTQAAQVAQRQKELDASQVTALEQREKTMAPMEKSLSGLIDQKLPERESVQMPEVPRPSIDPKEYEGLSMGLIGLALVGGAISKGNWLGVSSTLNGALKGFIDGNHENAQREYDDYQRKFNAAKQHQQEIDKQFDDVLNNRKMSINEQLQKIQLLAAQHGREDVLFAAKQKSIDSVVKQIDAGRNQLLGVVQRKESVDERVNQQMAAVNARLSASGSKGAQLTPEGARLAGEIFQLTGQKPSVIGGSAQILNTMAASGTTAKDVAEGKVNFSAAMAGEKQAVQRSQAVERLTGSVAQLQGRIKELVAKLNGYGVPLGNKAINNIRSSVGSEELSELRTLMASASRQYIEAVTMPGSNAQMHVGAQNLADRMLNGNMNINELEGTFKAINREMKAMADQLRNQRDEGLKLASGTHAPISNSGSMPADISALVNKYGH